MTAVTPGVSCIVLAAGSSRRFGSDKRQARLPDGRTLLAATLASIPPLFDQYLLVLHPGDDELAVAHGGPWQVLIATTAGQGMGHSLATGLAACTGGTGALVVLADMPAVQPGTYAALVQLLRKDRLVLPRHAGRRGNPAGIGTHFFGELANPAGDEGARRLLQEHPAAIHWLDCDDPGVLMDVDRPADLGA